MTVCRLSQISFRLNSSRTSSPFRLYFNLAMDHVPGSVSIPLGLPHHLDAAAINELHRRIFIVSIPLGLPHHLDQIVSLLVEPDLEVSIPLGLPHHLDPTSRYIAGAHRHWSQFLSDFLPFRLTFNDVRSAASSIWSQFLSDFLSI